MASIRIDLAPGEIRVIKVVRLDEEGFEDEVVDEFEVGDEFGDELEDRA